MNNFEWKIFKIYVGLTNIKKGKVNYETYSYFNKFVFFYIIRRWI